MGLVRNTTINNSITFIAKQCSLLLITYKINQAIWLLQFLDSTFVLDNSFSFPPQL